MQSEFVSVLSDDVSFGHDFVEMTRDSRGRIYDFYCPVWGECRGYLGYGL